MVLLVLEAMKMEHPLVAHAAGRVREVRVVVGQMVDPDEMLVVVDAEESGEAEA
jgi:biotin carboxyl carrier protein